MQEEYSFLLKSQNTSAYFQSLLEQKMGNQEVILTTICQLSKFPVTTPVRHNHFNYIHCVFELEYWLEYYSQMHNKVDSNGFACPGCKNYTTFKDYGIDYNYYHILQELQLYKTKNPSIRLNTSQFIYIPSNKTYQVEEKITKKRLQLPGSKPISETAKRLNQKSLLSSQQKYIVEEIGKTLIKIQSFICNQIYRIVKQSEKNKNKLTFIDLQSKLALRKQDLRKVFQNSMKLISLGRQSVTNDFVFAIKKKIINNQVQSILIVYFVNYGIWQEFPLKIKGQPYVQLECALYIKGCSNNTHHDIYIVGGRKVERSFQSNQVLKISFPKSVFSGEEAKMIELPNLPIEGYNFMGTCYKQSLYVFYGQKCIQTQNNQRKCEQLNCQFVFENNQWKEMNLQLIDRIDGSYFTIQHNHLDKLILFFGGITKVADYCLNHRAPQQHQGQIFICRDKQFIGNTQKDFKIQFLDQDYYHKNVLAYPIFSCPYYGQKQLLLSGESMKYNNTDQRQIYTFDYGNATLKLNEFFSLIPSEYMLNSYKRKTINEDIFFPIQDLEGVLLFGNFYLMHQQELEQSYHDKNPQVIIQILKINLTNGEYLTIPYLESTISKQIADKMYQKLEDKLNQEII